MIEKWKPPSFKDKLKAFIRRWKWLISLGIAVALMVAAANYVIFAHRYELYMPLLFGALYYVLGRSYPLSLIPLGIFAIILATVIRFIPIERTVDAIWALFATRRRLIISSIVVVLVTIWAGYEIRHSWLFASTKGTEIARTLNRDSLRPNGVARFARLRLDARQYCVAPENAPVREVVRTLIPDKSITYVGSGTPETITRRWYFIIEFEREIEVYYVPQRLLNWEVTEGSEWRDNIGCYSGVLITRLERDMLVTDFLTASQMP